MIDTECFEKVSLIFSAIDLPKMDRLSATDGFLAIYQLDPHNQQPIFLGNTSVVRDNNSPEWPDQLIMDYHFENIQKILVKCYDQDDKAPLTQYEKHDYIGEFTFTLSSLICAKNQRYQSGFTNGKTGTITITAEPVASTRDLFNVTFSGKELTNVDGLLGKSDPFINIRRIREDGTYQLVWKSEAIKNTLSPIFPAARIPLQTLCNGDIDRPLIIEFMDWEKSGNHQYMGSVKTTVKDLLESGGKPFDVIEDKKKGTMIGTIFKKAYVNSGKLFATNCSIEIHPTFSDYIFGGCEVSALVAIDYTGSNGDPNSPSSLHYVSTLTKNQYQLAIETARVIEPYDTDKMFPVFGFGAYTMTADGKWSNRVEHCFQLGTGEVHGTEGILDAYKESLKKVKLSGPTLMAPLIQQACIKVAAANCTQEHQKYHILLILTDGAINDEEATIDSIIAASNLPLSIIIIGVGNADFSSMVKLDSDKGLLRNGSKVAARDIVQFVPFNDYVSKGPSILAQEVLKELPGQVLQYFNMKKIKPNKSI